MSKAVVIGLAVGSDVHRELPPSGGVLLCGRPGVAVGPDFPPGAKLDAYRSSSASSMRRSAARLASGSPRSARI